MRSLTHKLTTMGVAWLVVLVGAAASAEDESDSSSSSGPQIERTSDESISDLVDTPADDERSDQKETSSKEDDEESDESSSSTSSKEDDEESDESSSSTSSSEDADDASGREKSESTGADDEPGGDSNSPSASTSSKQPTIDTDALLEKVRDIRRATDKVAQTARRPAPSTVEQAYRDIPGRPDAESIFKWVETHVEFEPYTGSMRGARGTLETGLGNSVDQALLISNLLDRADVEHRFALGRIPPPAARRLLALFVGEAELVSTASVQSEGGFADKRAFGKQRFRNLVGEHVWIQVAEETDDGPSYRDLDPVLSDTYGSTPAKLESHTDSIPENIQARLEVSLRAVFTDGQRKNLLTIEGPLARYSYKTIQFSFSSSDEIQNMIVPRVTLPDTSREGGRFLPDKLKRLWIEYDTSVGPLERRFVHTLYRKEGESSQLFQHDDAVTALTILPGWTSKTRLAELTRESIRGATEEMARSIRQHDSDQLLDREGGRRAARSALEAVGSIAPLLYARHLDELTRRLARTMGVRAVLLQPRIIRVTLARNGDELSVDLDARGGRLEAVPRKGIPESAATGFLTLFGRIESQLRRSVVRNMTGRDSMTVEKIFQQVQKQNTPVMTLHSNNIDALGSLEIPKSTREQMRQHVVERGWLLLTPKRPVGVEGVEHFGWWSLEPDAGLLRGNLVRSLADLRATRTEAAPSMVAYSAVDLLRRSFRTARRTLIRRTRYKGLVCESLDDVRLISRSLCATSELLSIPKLSACKPGGGAEEESGPKSGGGRAGLGFARQSCKASASKTRCGAAMASAFLKGRLAPVYRSKPEGSGDDGEQTSSPSQLSCVGE